MNIDPNPDFLLDIAQHIDEQAQALQEFSMEACSHEIEQLRSVSAELRKIHGIFLAATIVAGS